MHSSVGGPASGRIEPEPGRRTARGIRGGDSGGGMGEERLVKGCEAVSRRWRGAAVLFTGLVVVLGAAGVAQVSVASATSSGGAAAVTVSSETHHDTSPPLRSLRGDN